MQYKSLSAYNASQVGDCLPESLIRGKGGEGWRMKRHSIRAGRRTYIW